MKIPHVVVAIVTIGWCLGGYVLWAAGQGGANRPVDYNRKTDGLDKLWAAYRSGYPYSGYELRWISATNMTAELEAEICRVCVSTQSVDLLLFLGLGRSQGSRVLLEAATTNTSVKVVEAAQLALARRGDERYGKMFLSQLYARPESTNAQCLLVADMDESGRVIANLLYIGTAECMAALFDMAPESGQNSVCSPNNIKEISILGAQDMRCYFEGAGIPIPSGIQSGKEIVAWWKKNRDVILGRMKGKDAQSLPRREIIMMMSIW
jgi:hypothetical protein